MPVIRYKPRRGRARKPYERGARRDLELDRYTDSEEEEEEQSEEEESEEEQQEHLADPLPDAGGEMAIGPLPLAPRLATPSKEREGHVSLTDLYPSIKEQPAATTPTRLLGRS